MQAPLVSVALCSAVLMFAGPAPAAVPVEPLRFVSRGDTLAGALALPEGDGPFPLLVVLHGSEPGRRENRFVDTLRAMLRPVGMGVFSFDKRGVGESQGRYQELPDLVDAAEDALAAVEALCGDPRVDARRVGVIGVSQGGWVGPIMAARSHRIAFVIAVSAPALSPEAQGYHLRMSELLETGFTPAEATAANSVRAALFHFWRGDGSRDSAQAAWDHARAQPWFDRVTREDEVFRQMAGATRVPAPERLPVELVTQLQHATYEPIPVAERVAVPVLHVYGASDAHLPVESSRSALELAYRRGGNRNVTFLVHAGAGHFLQRTDRSPECLRCPRPPGAFAYAPGYPLEIRDWLRDQHFTQERP